MSVPNYEHRTFASGNPDTEAFDVNDLQDSIGLMTEQMQAVILQMQSQFIEENTYEQSASINFSTLEVIRKESLDILALIYWFSSKEIKKQKMGVHYEINQI